MAHTSKVEQPIISQRHTVGPERVSFTGTGLVQKTPDRGWRLMQPRCRNVGEDAYYAVFSEWRRGPPSGAVRCKPDVCRVMMDVIRVKQSHKYIDIKQRDAVHGSSRRRFTSSIVKGGLPFGRRGISGTPFRIATLSVGSSAFRARSDKTLPAVVPRFAAISFAAWRMSSSTSSVVLIALHRNITHQMRQSSPRITAISVAPSDLARSSPRSPLHAQPSTWSPALAPRDLQPMARRPYRQAAKCAAQRRPPGARYSVPA